MRYVLDARNATSCGSDFRQLGASVSVMGIFSGLFAPLSGQPVDRSIWFPEHITPTYGKSFRDSLRVLFEETPEPMTTIPQNHAIPNPSQTARGSLPQECNRWLVQKTQPHLGYKPAMFNERGKFAKVFAHEHGMIDRLVRDGDDRMAYDESDEQDRDTREVIDLRDVDHCVVCFLRPGEAAKDIIIGQLDDPIRNIGDYFTCRKLKEHAAWIAEAIISENSGYASKESIILTLTAMIDPNYVVDPDLDTDHRALSSIRVSDSEHLAYADRKAVDLQTLLVIKKPGSAQQHFHVDYKGAEEHLVDALCNLFQKNTPPLAHLESVMDADNIPDYAKFTSLIHRVLSHAKDHALLDVRRRANLLLPAITLVADRVNLVNEYLHGQSTPDTMGDSSSHSDDVAEDLSPSSGEDASSGSAEFDVDAPSPNDEFALGTSSYIRGFVVDTSYLRLDFSVVAPHSSDESD